MKNLALLLVSLLLAALLCGCGVSEEALRPYLSPPGTAPAPTLCPTPTAAPALAPTPSPTPTPQPDLAALDLKILTRIFAGVAGSRGARFRPLPRQKDEKIRVFARMGKRGKNLGQKRKKTVDKNHLLAYNSPCRREMRDARDAKAGRGGQGSIAQLGEHLPYKQGVTGSSPVVPTKEMAR